MKADTVALLGMLSITGGGPQVPSQAPPSPPTALPSQSATGPLSPADCFEFLSARNSKEELVPEAFMPGVTYRGLKVEHCFGLRLDPGHRLAAACNPQGYGMSGSLHEQAADGSFGKEVHFKLIGFLVVEGACTLGGQPLPEGPYALQAFQQSLHLVGNNSDAKLYNAQLRRQVCQPRTLKFKLAVPLPAVLVEPGGIEHPQFTLEVRKGGSFLSLHGNSWRLDPAASPKPSSRDATRTPPG